MGKIITPAEIIYLPPEIRTQLKRLCPYVGPLVPDSVKEMAFGYWGPDHQNEAGWFRDVGDDGDGYGWQYVLHLCDMDIVETCDPAGHVAIRPLEDGRYRLILVYAVCRKAFDPEDLIFNSIEEAKGFLDNLLAASTPEIPVLKL